MTERSREEDGIYSCKRASKRRNVSRVDEKTQGYEAEMTNM